jgi:hypothetical protein
VSFSGAVKLEEKQVAPLEGLELGVGRGLPEVDLVEGGGGAVLEPAQIIEPLIIRDTDIEPHLHPAKIGRLYCLSKFLKATMPSPIRLYVPKNQIMIRFYREMRNCQ